jgi:transposase
MVCDKFHVLKHANAAVDETRRAEFFRKGGHRRGLVRGERWLLLTRWHHLPAEKRATLSTLFAVNRRLAKAYLLREQLEQLWTYTYAGAARRFLTTWLRALRWQRLLSGSLGIPSNVITPAASHGGGCPGIGTRLTRHNASEGTTRGQKTCHPG